jgi:hypothetical protein
MAVLEQTKVVFIQELVTLVLALGFHNSLEWPQGILSQQLFSLSHQEPLHSLTQLSQEWCLDSQCTPQQGILYHMATHQQ